LSKLELELLLLFYNFSDQRGVVDTQAARIWAKNKLGVFIPDSPFTLLQEHFDILMDSGMVPDTRQLMSNLIAGQLKDPPR
jgi:hypothetical protein